jgi:hypothetical protein
MLRSTTQPGSLPGFRKVYQLSPGLQAWVDRTTIHDFDFPIFKSSNTENVLFPNFSLHSSHFNNKHPDNSLTVYLQPGLKPHRSSHWPDKRMKGSFLPLL